MIRTQQFRISRRPYAVDLDGLTLEQRSGPAGPYWGRIPAVWFRRRTGGVTVACLGYLWALQTVRPETATEFLVAHTDGRYGGDCEGRWDGQLYWGAQEPETAARHLAFLRPMLDAFPVVPDGYDGWWSFG
ncbi:hypothetical protein [Streptomyces sp. NPDC049879]|uniref:hypothetical protein n=1 Tax=Streptomyces sp. NPDC049879 TaxID=3365598 RepID=UPI0037BD39C4